MDIEVSPEGSLEVLSQVEVDALRREGEGGLYPLLRRCALAVLRHHHYPGGSRRAPGADGCPEFGVR